MSVFHSLNSFAIVKEMIDLASAYKITLRNAPTKRFPSISDRHMPHPDRREFPFHVSPLFFSHSCFLTHAASPPLIFFPAPRTDLPINATACTHRSQKFALCGTKLVEIPNRPFLPPLLPRSFTRPFSPNFVLDAALFRMWVIFFPPFPLLR